jgi:hypothetical protein
MRKIHEQIFEERLKFKKGLQRKFVLEIKQKSGLTWAKLGDLLNVSEHTVRVDWGYELSTIPLSYAKRLLQSFPIASWESVCGEWVEEILPVHWGHQKRNINEVKIILSVL